MANTVGRWDFVPVYGVYLHVDDTPIPGNVMFALTQRITRVDGRVIYADGAVVQVTIGDTATQDSTIRSTVRAAWRAADELAQGEDFDGIAWDSWWDDVVVPAAIFTSFPAGDDPDIVQDDVEVIVSEALTSGKGRSYAIHPLITHTDLPVPGINLGTIEVPPGSPTVPAPMYAKGIPGGVASLDLEGKVPLEQLPDDVGGGPGGGVDEEAVVEIIEANPQAPADATVTDAKVPTGAAILLSKTADSSASGGRLAMTTAERNKLAAVPTDAQSASDVDSRADSRIATWVGAAPGALNTLDELAAALGDDANFAATVTTALAGKADDTAVIKKTGAVTKDGVLTLTSAPVVPDDSFTTAKVIGLDDALAAVEAVSGTYTLVYDYDDDDYPAVPGSPPTGTLIRIIYGPVQYTGPTWPGVIDKYEYIPVPAP